MSLLDLHRFRHRLQRPHLAASPRTPRLLFFPNPIYPPSQAARPAPALRPLQARCRRHPDQHLFPLLSGLCGNLDAVSADSTSHKGQYELCWADLWGSYCGCARALVFEGKEDL